MANEPHAVAARLEREFADGRLEFDPAQQAVAVRLDRLRLALQQRPPPASWRLPALRWLSPAAAPTRGLYLWGGVGRGKTHLLNLFYDSLEFAERERVHFHRFMRAVHAELRVSGRRTEPLEAVAARLAQRARVLCLDELFVADIADAMILAGLFTGLFRRGVTLVATSNTPPWSLYEDGLQRQRFLPAIESIQNHVDVVHLDGGTDYRLRRLEQALVYFDSGLPGTGDELRRLFHTLAAGSASGPARLVIEGRPIGALSTGPGLAWFDFAELCSGPRSQSDFIELARQYHTIFVSDVPVLTGADDDAARRFVMLIDETYDRGVNIVISAAADPSGLYRGERLRGEFERASSRLVEMQSRRYLAGPHLP